LFKNHRQAAPDLKSAQVFLLIVCRLQVQVYKKTAKQPLPSLKLYNPPAAAGGSGEQAAAWRPQALCRNIARAAVLAFSASSNIAVVWEIHCN
jgi:hypothetical protein